MEEAEESRWEAGGSLCPTRHRKSYRHCVVLDGADQPLLTFLNQVDLLQEKPLVLLHEFAPVGGHCGFLYRGRGEGEKNVDNKMINKFGCPTGETPTISLISILLFLYALFAYEVTWPEWHQEK